MKARVYLLIATALVYPSVAAATDTTARNEARAQALFTEIRCVVCQGESIADSDADIAADMRRDIRADITKGQSDSQIRQGLYDHYGDYVLFRPRVSWSNLILWLFPPLLVLTGVICLYLFRQKHVKSIPYELSEDEEKKLRDLIKNDD